MLSRADARRRAAVAGHPEAEARVDTDAVPFGRHVPRAVAVDDEIVLAVAVVVEQQRNVARDAAETVDLVDDAVARGGAVPGAVAVDEQPLDPVPLTSPITPACRRAPRTVRSR